jgi:TfoX/Sxy family transcriptional regulator of competence genes
MASNPDFVQYIADQCAGAGEITVKKMFGDYGIYCDGIIFGLICDNRFYLKPTEAGRSLLRSVEMRPPYDGAKDYFFIEDVDDHDYITGLVRATCKELPLAKPKRK